MYCRNMYCLSDMTLISGVRFGLCEWYPPDRYLFVNNFPQYNTQMPLEGNGCCVAAVGTVHVSSVPDVVVTGHRSSVHRASESYL
jgi:hypothetical protein